MTDIVERLRAYTIGDQIYHPLICSEAADEIENLRIDCTDKKSAWEAIAEKNGEIAILRSRLVQAEADRESYKDQMIRAQLALHDARRGPSREQIARVIAGKIACEQDCMDIPSGCGCSDDAADAVMALYSPALPPSERGGAT